MPTGSGSPLPVIEFLYRLAVFPSPEVPEALRLTASQTSFVSNANSVKSCHVYEVSKAK